MSSTKDYFSLIEDSACSKSGLQPADIESGLAAVTSSPTLFLNDRALYVSVILQRFVYTDVDRLSPKAIYLAMGVLKAFGRLINSSDDELVSEKAVGGLLQLALSLKTSACASYGKASETNYALDACNEALTCVANAMLLQPTSRAHMAKCDGFKTISEILCSILATNATSAFLCGRCLLLSLVTEENARHCVKELYLQVVLAQTISIFLDRQRSGFVAPSDRFTPEQVMAELFKAAMSLCVYFQRSVRHGPSKQDNKDDSLPPKQAVEFADLLKVSLATLNQLKLADDHLTDSAKQAASIALNFPTKAPDSIRAIWLPASNKWKNLDSIYELFKAIVGQIFGGSPTGSDDKDKVLLSVSELYQNELTPLALILVRLMSEHSDARLRIFHQVYPQNANIDYSLLPEDRPGISARIVRLMRVPQGGMLPGAMGDFLLAVLGHDVKQFIMGVGYGNAAGYMFARGIEMPADALDQASASVDAGGMTVDPITGCSLNQTDIDRELANMTEEEKEREAERLFVLFERLNRTGFIKADNPVRAAVESGRFQEIPDDGNSESRNSSSN
ncbi:hypothetical protein GGI25_005896 [Coemansia spiralis]|uniref:Uncharacterized protein n=2 Tax=Coemansia TaxID=4863 RepID=A0A9W8KU89_9FUNG|nr:guanine nucleotide exchange factor [Coemansia spiralis]KAJ1989507.1 hypothetical protein EDC05_004623 [Coemansia umbellata]KAJ2619187.1 hypothetical protein GGI26_006035 [Coemansia sp. RSA 1358]KAJ2670285.1 hypothetical protein GGI25_005896 [Coemansia spiralis]